MKNRFNLLLLLTLFTTLFVSCSDEDDPIEESPNVADAIILNYGDYEGSKSTITAINDESMTITNNFYESINNVPLVSNVSHAFNYNENVYILGNNTDELLWVNSETFQNSENAISADIVKPRYGVGSGNYLYISCWGGDIWADESLSYIAKFNLATKMVEDKIQLPGGPEGMVVAGNKLYAALNYKDSVAVIDLNSDEISFIETPAVSSYFIQDANNNLYVSLVSTYSDFSETTGLGYINTTTDELEAVYEMGGVTTSYVNVMAANNDVSKIYVVTEGANWGDPGALAVFDVASQQFEEEKFLNSVEGINGVGYYNNQVLVFISESVTANGSVKVYQPDGTFADEFETGKAPFMLLDIE
ncbi:hypothetical protein [Maribellus mangrovi]|uniref:hypothetical protein n=1 Tax=Maribellus mangrovi TaxID=3133146 RepID=UPI0030EE9EF7